MRALSTLLVVVLTAATVGSQEAPLTIIRADPSGELTRLDDATQIRITFSEPMVPLGVVSDGRAPGWLRMQPSWPGAFYWAGRKTLVFSPDVDKPMPSSTRFTIRIDATATSVGGRRLPTPFEFTFSTPTLRLNSVSAERKTDRFDSLVLLDLYFNQPIDELEALSHLRVVMEPHAWKRPVPSATERAYWAEIDPEGLARFDRKVAEVDRVAGGTDRIEVRIADRKLWGDPDNDSPGRLVVETITSPPPEAWLRIHVDEAMRLIEGDLPYRPQSETVKLEQALFLLHCSECDNRPRVIERIGFSGYVTAGAARQAVLVTDVTDRQAVRLMSNDDAIKSANSNSIEFAPQPAMSRRQIRVAGLQSHDGQALGYSWAGLSDRRHDDADFELGGLVFEAGSGSHLPLISRNIVSFKQWLLPVTPLTLVPTLDQISERGFPGFQTYTDAQPPGEGRVTALRSSPDIPQRHPIDLGQRLPDARGWFWVTARLPTTIAPEVVFPAPSGGIGSLSSVVQVTNLGITIKHGPLSTLVFVTRLDSGAAVDNAVVTIRDARNQARWTGRTGRDGVTSIPPVELPARRPSEQRRWFAVTAEKDGDAAYVLSNWNSGGQGGNSTLRDASWYQRDRILRGSLFSDRGAYRPGDRVRLKSVLRDDTRAGMTLLPAGTPLELVISNPRYEDAVKQTVAVSDWSSVEWEWTIPADAPLGRYSVELSRTTPGTGGGQEWISGTFIVAAYKTPEFRVGATLSSNSGLLGAPIRSRVEARYLFGGHVGSRRVHWSIRRSPSSAVPDAVVAAYPREKYDIGYLPAARYVADDLQSEWTTLDAEGNLDFMVPTPAGDAAYSYSIQAAVSSVSEQNVAGRAALNLYPASIFVAVARPTRFIGAGDGTTVAVAALDHGGRAVPGIKVELTLLRVDWTYGSTWTQTETPTGSWTVTSSAGEESVRLTFPRSGSYVLRAVARDSAGRTTRTESQFYSLGGGRPMWRSEGNRIELVPERPSWKPGETARILIQSPWERATALLTVEREGIRRHLTFSVSSMQDTVDVPITEADVPNVFVSVVLVKGRTGEPRAADGTDPGRPAYRVGHAELKVDSARKRLSVGVLADRQEYRPGHRASVAVNVADADGRPASSEVTFWAVDEGVLSLTGYTLPDVVEEIYRPKPLEVMTSDNREHLLMRLDGDSGPQPFPMVPRSSDISRVTVFAAAHRSDFEVLPGFGRSGTRKDFRPVVFWLGSVSTGADGHGQTTVRLPDSLTAYRIMAVAADRQSRFGNGELEIRAAKPLALLPILPRFLSLGDRAALGATVTYSGGTAATASVTIESSDERVVQFGAPAATVIPIEAGRPTPVTFDAVARDVGRTRLRVTVRAGEEADAFEVWLPVTAPLRPQVTAAYGTVSNVAAKEGLTLPPGVHPERGSLTVELASTALVGLGPSARYVVGYPHECAEQRASRALVYLLSSKLDSAYNLATAPEKYRAAAETELTALAGYECDSGALGLFPGQCRAPSPYASAYALYVLNVARRLGVNVDALRNRSIEFLKNELTRTRDRDNADFWWYRGSRAAYAAFVAKVLTEAGESVSLGAIPILNDLDAMPIFALSYLADVHHAQGNHGAVYQNVIRKIVNSLRVSADGAHADENDEASLSWMWLDNIGSTAIVLEGFSRRGDAPDVVVPLVRWLMSERRNGHWGQTHTDARTLESLVAYHAAFESDAPQMTATTAIGNKRLAKTSFKGQSTRARQVVISMRDLREHLANSLSPQLSISRDGQGTVHYTARLEAYVPDGDEPFERGFVVRRSYERVSPQRSDMDAMTFAAGDVVRVRVRITLRSDGQYLALTDPLPAGFEALDEHFETTQRNFGESSRFWWWANWAFDHVEKRDDRVLAYANYLSPGTHELTYLVRAVTSGTFSAGGATLEAMYAPEWSGKSASATVRVR